MTRFDDRVAGFAEFSAYADSARIIVRDSTSWRSAWNTINSGMVPQPQLPVVDFQREAVVVAAMGARPSGGYRISLEGASEGGGAVEITVRSTRPGGQCLVEAVNTHPVDVAKITATNLPIRFRELNDVVTCSVR